MAEVKITVLRVDGTREDVTMETKSDYFLPLLYPHIDETCDCIDIVRLPYLKKIMLVDDNGIAKGLPRNAEATLLYHSVCIPGTTHEIVGNVVLVDEEDFK